jgi:hypothetical protein
LPRLENFKYLKGQGAVTVAVENFKKTLASLAAWSASGSTSS